MFAALYQGTYALSRPGYLLGAEHHDHEKEQRMPSKKGKLGTGATAPDPTKSPDYRVTKQGGGDNEDKRFREWKLNQKYGKGVRPKGCTPD